MGFSMGDENQKLINLVKDAQNDVKDAFDKLYHESFRHAYCTASLLLKNEQDIEDVLQNSYMYVAKYIKDLKNPESFNNWLGVIVKHECQKHISKQKRASDIFRVAKKAKEFDLTDENQMLVDYMEKSESREAIQRIVDELPQDKRACIVLFYYEQHSLTEISEILGVPEGTVMSRLYYARKKLEKEFGKLQKKDESLFGVSVIPLIVSLFAYQAKTAVIPPAIESGVIAAVTSAEGLAVVSGASSALAGTTAAAGSVSAGASTAGAAGAAGTAVATKVAAVAVAASVAVGGGVATVNHIKNSTEVVTTKAASTSITEEHATVAAVFDETVLNLTEAYTSDISDLHVTETLTDIVSAKGASTTEQSATIKPSAVETTKAATSKPSTTNETAKQTTTQRVTTTKTTTTQKETTTKKVTTTAEPTTNAADVFSVSGGVLSEYTGTESNVSIPSTVGSSTVTAIGTGAFAGNTDITSVSMPSTVTRIGMEAFSDCTNLKSVSLPSSLQSIGIGAFCNCTSLTNVDIPSGVTSIGDDAFADCTKLSSITIPSSVVSIGDNAFGGCNNLVINCSEGSAAYNYAIENSINYSLV